MLNPQPVELREDEVILSQMIIWVSGPTGSGKTTLIRSLRASGYSVVEENVPEASFKAFLSEPNANCEQLQRQIMQARFDGWQRVSCASRIAFDRSIDEDIEVFCRMHWQAGRLTDGQFAALAKFGRRLQERMPKPDLVFFMTADQRVLLRRLKDLSFPPLIIDHLNEQLALYAEWLQTRNGEITQLDTSRLGDNSLSQFILELRSC